MDWINSWIKLFPEQASEFAWQIDALYFYLVAISLFFTVGVVAAITFFAIYYREREKYATPDGIEGSTLLEVVWSIIPFVISMTIFVGGAVVFYTQYRVPANPDMEIYVTGKQWMWKIQHSTGQREINELHVPIGRKIKLTMTTEDVLHDFFIPAFRTKADVVPGRYTTIWFEPTKPGRYHIFCAEYCGLNHSGMGGWVTVMEQRDFDNWLGGNVSNQTPAEAGKDLFENKLGCASCHQQNNIGRGPTLNARYGTPQKLMNGQSVTMDDTYIRNSILNPQAEIVEGYQPIMPTFKGQVNEEQLVQLVAYIKSIGGQNGGATTTNAPATNTTNSMNNSSNMSAPNPNSPTMPANRPTSANLSAPNPNSPTIESNNRATNRNSSGNQQKGAR